jgi:hypothetical protein
MKFTNGKVNYWFDTFKHLNPFDIISYDELVALYMKNSELLNENKFERLGGDNERPINSEVDKIDTTKSWSGYDPIYYNIDPTGKKMVQAKPDVVSMDMAGLGKRWSHFIYLQLPADLINKYMIATHDNPDVTIMRKFVEEVESTEKSWDGDWKSIEEKYNGLYSEKSSYSDFYETHETVKWKQDFVIDQYITIKKNGLIFPICYNSKNYMLKRGTHRAIMLAMTGSDVPIFLQYPNMDLNTDIVYDVQTENVFTGDDMIMSVDVKNKNLEFNFSE